MDQRYTANDFEDLDNSKPEQSKSFQWQAPEFLHHAKSITWYTTFILITVLLSFILWLALGNDAWVSILIVIIMSVALLLYANKKPRTLNYQLDSSSLTIHGKRFPLINFRSFSVFNEGGVNGLIMTPTERFMPSLTIITFFGILKRRLARSQQFWLAFRLNLDYKAYLGQLG